jgi:hypothetical protein
MADKSTASTVGKAIGTGVAAVASVVASHTAPYAATAGKAQRLQGAAGREAAHSGASYESRSTSGQGEK